MLAVESLEKMTSDGQSKSRLCTSRNVITTRKGLRQHGPLSLFSWPSTQSRDKNRSVTFCCAFAKDHHTTHNTQPNTPSLLFRTPTITSYTMMFAARRVTSASALTSRTASARPLIAGGVQARTFADVQIEHGRGEWKTYGDLENYKPGKFQIKTFNKISPVGLARFPTENYDVRVGDEEAANAHSILLRSHKLKEEEVAHTVRAIAR